MRVEPMYHRSLNALAGAPDRCRFGLTISSFYQIESAFGLPASGWSSDPDPPVHCQERHPVLTRRISDGAVNNETPCRLSRLDVCHEPRRFLSERVSSSPDGLDVVVSSRRSGELSATVAGEDVDDLRFGLVRAIIQLLDDFDLSLLHGAHGAKRCDHLVVSVMALMNRLPSASSQPLGATRLLFSV